MHVLSLLKMVKLLQVAITYCVRDIPPSEFVLIFLQSFGIHAGSTTLK